MHKCASAVRADCGEGFIEPPVLCAAIPWAVIGMSHERRKFRPLPPAMVVKVPVGLVGAKCAVLVTHEGAHVEGLQGRLRRYLHDVAVNNATLLEFISCRVVCFRERAVKRLPRAAGVELVRALALRARVR